MYIYIEYEYVFIDIYNITTIININVANKIYSESQQFYKTWGVQYFDLNPTIKVGRVQYSLTPLVGRVQTGGRLKKVGRVQ